MFGGDVPDLVSTSLAAASTPGLLHVTTKGASQILLHARWLLCSCIPSQNPQSLMSQIQELVWTPFCLRANTSKHFKHPAAPPNGFERSKTESIKGGEFQVVTPQRQATQGRPLFWRVWQVFMDQASSIKHRATSSKHHASCTKPQPAAPHHLTFSHPTQPLPTLARAAFTIICARIH